MKDNNTIPKGFKMTELGLLPEEWDVVRLGIYCRVFGGYAFKSSDFSNEGTPIIKIGNLQGGTIIIDKRTNFYPKEKITENLKKFILKTNDVLIALTGATTGKVAIFPKDFESALLNQRVGKFDVYHEDLNKLFARFYSITKNFQEGIRGNILQSAQGNISPKQIGNLKVPLPPLSEQKKIASVLSAVQEAKEKAATVIEAARELKKSLMTYLFTYGPVPMKKKENVPLKETGIGLIPKDWTVVKLGDIVNSQYGYTAPAEEKNIGPKFLRITDIDDTGNVSWPTVPYCSISSEDYHKFILRDDDILFARIGATTGKTCIIKNPPECVFASYLIRLTIDDKLVAYPDFVHNFTKSVFYWIQVNANKEGKLKKGVSATLLKNLWVPLPPLHIQQKITKILAAVDEKIETEENKKKALEELFKTLLNNLMTARIRVNHLEIEV